MPPRSWESLNSELARLVREKDWSKTPLGPREGWSASLNLAVDLILSSGFPMALRWGPDFVLIYNDGYRPILGEKHPWALGLPVRKAWSEVWHQLEPVHTAILSGASAGIFSEDQLYRIQRHGTEWDEAHFTVAYSPVHDESAPTKVGGILITAVETTESVRAEAALRISQERYQVAIDAARAIGTWDLDVATDTVVSNGKLAEYYAVDPRKAPQGVPLTAFLQGIHPGDRERVTREVRRCIAMASDFAEEYRVQQADGAVRWVFARGRCHVDDQGRVVRMPGATVDITDRKAAEEALQALNETLEQRVAAESAKRAETEEALRQAQKMEAIGQLTGGVAHDFNNLLTVIIGGLDTILRARPGETVRIRRSAEMALQGAQRAAALTARLLAFSRRQPLAPKPMDLNVLIRNMTELLHRTLGEHIELEGVMAPRLWLAEIDNNQLEIAVLNLAVNARDAMPNGGKLTIETANTFLDDTYVAKDSEVIAGQYVMISVSDNGIGMPSEARTRAFEPFFTTKEAGKGTGLGLSMVYGFVKQSGGHVTIYSEEGMGTTIKLYFPRFLGEGMAAEAEEALVPPGQGEETILVVEDSDDVRAYSAMILRELGYSVLEAADAASAMTILERSPRVDLLFTDVVLPGMSGRVLADAAIERWPKMKVLFTTGYSRNAIVHQGRLDAGVNLITKPFTFDQLGARVREVLDALAGAT
jgi:signal transduction histidine kinase